MNYIVYNYFINEIETKLKKNLCLETFCISFNI